MSFVLPLLLIQANSPFFYSLVGNPFEEEGVIALADGLQHESNQLQHLCFHRVHMNDAGVNALVFALTHANNKLKLLEYAPFFEMKNTKLT